jgi:N-acetyl-gamma-glutamyl-phosphate reductase/acetylglutamate kinase
VQDVGEVERIVRQFEANGRIPRSYIPVGPSAPPHRAGGADDPRAFSTSARSVAAGACAGYVTLAEAPVPIATTQVRKKIALIGARGYTGRRSPRVDRRSPPSTFRTGPRPFARVLDLSHGSSRQLAGFLLDEYTMAPVTYGNLSPTDVQRTEAEGAVDAWVLALPNGAGAPFAAALDEGAKARGDGGSVAVELSADYHFDESG